MATFRSPGTICETETVNFFTSGNYAVPSFSAGWTTRTTPDVEGLGTPVYVLVLEKFDIPIDSSGGLPPGGTLPGIDIKNMPAIEALKLSMAEALTVGEWWDIYEDGNGGVRFSKVFDSGSPGQTVSLNVRQCIPTANKRNQVDMVIVHGYNPPPVRYLGEWKEIIPVGTGEINPETVSGRERLFTVAPHLLLGLADTCQARLLQTTVYKSYPDPIKTDIVYGSQDVNPFYDPKAHESLVAFVQRISGMDDSPEEAARVTYKFEDTTPWFKPIALPAFSPASQLSCTAAPTGDTIEYWEATFSYSIPTYTDRYGMQWPFVRDIQNIFYIGSELKEIRSSGVGPSTVFIEPLKGLKSLSIGQQWLWYNSGVNQVEISIFYQPNVNPGVWEAIVAGLSGPLVIKYWDGQPYDSSHNYTSHSLSGGASLLGSPNGLGTVVEGMWLNVSLARPSVAVNDPRGEALEYASRLKVEAAPIILLDEPPFTAYKWSGGVVEVDHTVGLADNDPTTCQNFETTPEALMQDRQQGNTMEVSLPFCESSAVCAKVAATIYDYMNFTDVQTYSLSCGPDDNPVLGAAVNGFPSDLRINSINYSYTDASAFTIEVELGPVFANVGSWNNTAWLRQRETVDREGIVIYSGGDGVNYRVRVQGLGEYNAINSTNTIFRSGERVTVKIYNVPVEE